MVQNLIYNLCESFIKNIDGIASITKNTPPLEEILAPVTFEVTANYVNEYYWATFYTSMANYQAPEGTQVFSVYLDGKKINMPEIKDGIVTKGQGVVLRSSTNRITLTKTYSRSSDNYSDNSLIGTDYLITNPGNAYVLNYNQSHGLGFYPLSSTGRIKANTAYLVMPITYLTQWKIVGNSEVHGNEIWSCGEYNPIDGKYHILVQPLGGNIADIALTEPLRKVNNIADTIEFPSDTEGKALVTRQLKTLDLGSVTPGQSNTSRQDEFKWRYGELGIKRVDNTVRGNILCAIFNTGTAINTYSTHKTCISNALNNGDAIMIFDEEYCSSNQAATFQAARNGVEVIYELATPTTELVDAPQIAEADSYFMVISQGGKAVEWSSFETE